MGQSWIAACALLALLIAAPLWAAEEETATELVKKTQNPVADLISVPFQKHEIRSNFEWRKIRNARLDESSNVQAGGRLNRMTCFDHCWFRILDLLRISLFAPRI